MRFLFPEYRKNGPVQVFRENFRLLIIILRKSLSLSKNSPKTLMDNGMPENFTRLNQGFYPGERHE
jgi:hypothetical protein